MVYFAHAKLNTDWNVCGLHETQLWETKAAADEAVTDATRQFVVPVRVEPIAGGDHLAVTLDNRFWMVVEGIE